MRKARQRTPRTLYPNRPPATTPCVVEYWCHLERSHSPPGLRGRNARADIVFITTTWGVEEKHEKYKKVFATVLASFNPAGK